MTVLDRIVMTTRDAVAKRKAERPAEALAEQARAVDPRGGFYESVCQTPGLRVIAEFKRASPSAGAIAHAAQDPVQVARLYQDGGAAAMSVLTEEDHFHGSLADLQAVRQAVTLPLLRKDFVIDEYQLDEAVLAGADAVLLIAECLPGDDLGRLFDAARARGLAALVELYDADNADRVVATGAPLIGVNNRDLRTFHVDLDHVLRLRERIPPDRTLVAESGIKTDADIARLRSHGIHAVLIGETLMRSDDPVATLRSMTA